MKLSHYAFVYHGNDAKLYNGIHDLEKKLADAVNALRTIAHDPIGHAEASHREVLEGCVEIAKAAIAKAEAH